METLTYRLHLRDIIRDDLEPMIALWTDDGVKQEMGSWGPQTKEEVLPWIEGAVNANEATPRFAHISAIVERNTGVVIGFIGLGRPSEGKEHWGELDFGYAIRPEFRGRGFGIEALRATIAFCFEELRAGSFFGETRADNLASARVMQKAGMRAVGLSPDGQTVFRIERDCSEHPVAHPPSPLNRR